MSIQLIPSFLFHVLFSHLKVSETRICLLPPASPFLQSFSSTINHEASPTTFNPAQFPFADHSHRRSPNNNPFVFIIKVKVDRILQIQVQAKHSEAFSSKQKCFERRQKNRITDSFESRKGRSWKDARAGTKTPGRKIQAKSSDVRLRIARNPLWSQCRLDWWRIKLTMLYLSNTRESLWEFGRTDAMRTWRRWGGFRRRTEKG